MIFQYVWTIVRPTLNTVSLVVMAKFGSQGRNRPLTAGRASPSSGSGTEGAGRTRTFKEGVSEGLLGQIRHLDDWCAGSSVPALSSGGKVIENFAPIRLGAMARPRPHGFHNHNEDHQLFAKHRYNLAQRLQILSVNQSISSLGPLGFDSSQCDGDIEAHANTVKYVRNRGASLRV